MDKKNNENLLGKALFLPRTPFLWLIRLYQKTFSPDHGWCRVFYPYGCCRFTPTCSEYAYKTIQKKGLILGLPKVFWRILRCNPWNKGGIDLS